MWKIRYRKPSLKTIVGVTRLKKRAKKAVGITAVMRPFRAFSNFKRRLLRRVGYYSPPMKLLRSMKRGQMPGPIGPIQMTQPAEKGTDG